MRTLALLLCGLAVSIRAEPPPQKRTPAATTPSKAPAPSTKRAPAGSPSAPAAPAPPAALAPSPSLSFGVRVMGNGGYAHVPDGGVGDGLGYGVLVPFFYELGSGFRLTVMPGFQVMTLTRIVDGTGEVLDANPAQFTQSLRCASLSAYLGSRLIGPVVISTDERDFRHALSVWVEVGGDFLYPLSASQSDNFGDSSSFTTHAKYFFLTAGASAEYRLFPRLGLGASAAVGYNTLGSGDQLLLSRFSLDALFHL